MQVETKKKRGNKDDALNCSQKIFFKKTQKYSNDMMNQV